ncbi:unnamed protein product, partial [Gongylonema pulchrum]|uniref:MULE domain-containing protein n=1 Tax=Gongylonema pulchrum TaxID=637853 RepID=A0A183DII6_9BILA
MFSNKRTRNDVSCFTFFLTMAIECSSNERVRCIVTDFEATKNEMRKESTLFAAPCNFVLCELHLRSNVKILLRQCGASKEVQDKILLGIFGQEVQLEHGRERICGYLLPVRITSGLGIGRVTNNLSRNTIGRLKNLLQEIQYSGLHVIIRVVKELCKEEIARMKRSIIKNDEEYELIGKYAKFAVSADEWNQ